MDDPEGTPQDDGLAAEAQISNLNMQRLIEAIALLIATSRDLLARLQSKPVSPPPDEPPGTQPAVARSPRQPPCPVPSRTVGNQGVALEGASSVPPVRATPH
jgi:hypothetical protein